MIGHTDEVLDICFNSTGTRLVTASADGTARLYNVGNGICMAVLSGIIISYDDRTWWRNQQSLV